MVVHISKVFGLGVEEDIIGIHQRSVERHIEEKEKVQRKPPFSRLQGESVMKPSQAKQKPFSNPERQSLMQPPTETR